MRARIRGRGRTGASHFAAVDLDAWITIALVCTTGAISPGPSLAVVLKNTVDGGWPRGVACAVGHGLGIGVYALVAIAGLTALVAAIQRPVMIAGALYLVWMGATVLRASFRAAPPASAVDELAADAALAERALPSARRSGFVEGFAIAFLNPKIAVFFLALLSNLVPAGADPLERTGVAALAMLIDTVWYVIVAVVLAGTGAVDLVRRNGRAMDRVFGVVLVGLGGWLLWQSFGTAAS